MSKLKVFLFFLVLFLCTGCDGIIMSKKAYYPNGPVDGSSLFGSKFNKDDVRYAQGNLKYLDNIKTRNNSVYFSSIEEYNVLNYKIAKTYINNYKNFLKIDPDELELLLKQEQYGKKKEDIFDMMEIGILPKRPIKNNISTMQALNDEHNKIAFPDYMNEYLDVKNEQNNDKKTDFFAFNDNEYGERKKNEIDTISADMYDRDVYIDTYLNSLSGNYGSNAERYTEEPL
jgi:hypothetical protein